jgi:hypothetical protein
VVTPYIFSSPYFVIWQTLIDDGTFEWLDGDGIWLPRRAVEGTFTVIGSFDARKANL